MSQRDDVSGGINFFKCLPVHSIAADATGREQHVCVPIGGYVE